MESTEWRVMKDIKLFSLMKGIGDLCVYLILIMLVLAMDSSPIKFIYLTLLGIGAVGNLVYLFRRWFG